MNLTPIFMSFALLWGNSQLQENADPIHTAKYEIGFQDDLPSIVSVRASLPYAKNLKISTYGAWSQPNGWGSFLNNLRVFDANGNPLAIEEKEKCVWTIAKSSTARIRVEYNVDLAHAKVEEWADGPKTTGAYWDGSALFTVTAPLILYCSAARRYEFEFKVPSDCQIYSPWRQLAKSNRYYCDSAEEAVNNTIVIGKPDALQVETPCFDVSVAMLGRFRGKADLIAGAVERYLKYYESFYNEQDQHKYLVVMFPQSLETGEAYSGSYVHVGPKIPTESNRPIWAGIVAHELGHFWLGKQIAAEDWATANWFSEGATEYIATLAMVRSGEISDDEFLNIVRRNIEFYILFKKGQPFDSVSLVEAGSNKSSNNVAIYNGGWVACFCLDILIRHRTNNLQSFDDFVRKLNEDFGKTSTKYDVGDLINIANKTSNSNTREFFNRYIVGKDSFPLENYFRRAGFVASLGAASAHIVRDSNADRLAARIRTALLGQKLTDLEKSIDEVFDQWNCKDSPGATVTITQRGRVILQRNYGLANLEYSVPINSKTDFHSASVAKQFTAYLVFLLNERGKLSLDDPVSKYFPDMPTSIGKVTVRQLLDHTSGIRDQWQLLALSGIQPEDVVTHEQVMQLIRRQTDLQFEPESKQAYCNSGYTVLAAIVEKVSGKPFRQFSDEEIFRPLKMNRTFFCDSVRKIVPNRAISYLVSTEKSIAKRELNYACYGATALNTCGADMGLWMMHLIHLHRTDSPILRKMLKRGELENGEVINFSNGLFVDTYRGTLMFGHPGADGGFRSCVFVFPEWDLGITVLANVNTMNHWEVSKTIANLFINDPDPKKEMETNENVESHDKWVGSYATDNGRVIVIDKRFGNLCYSIGPEFEIRELTLIESNQFKFGDSETTLEFSEINVEGDPRKKVAIKSSAPETAIQRGKMTATELASLVGSYASKELDSSYSAILMNDQLHLRHSRNGIIKLQEKSIDRFSTDVWYMPEIQFVRDETKKPIRFEVRLHDERGVHFGFRSDHSERAR